MKKLSKSAIAQQQRDAETLAKSVRFCVTLHMGPSEAMRCDCATLQEARKQEKLYNAHSSFGRRAIVYGVTEDSRQVVVPDDYEGPIVRRTMP